MLQRSIKKESWQWSYHIYLQLIWDTQYTFLKFVTPEVRISILNWWDMMSGSFGWQLQMEALDNLMLRGHTLVNQCCMCYCNEDIVDHLLLHCPVAHSLWMHMLQLFGIQWAMPGSMESLVFCWSYWLGKFNSNIWNLVPSCLMWIVWT